MKHKILKWILRIIALVIFLFGMAFYLGEGSVMEHIPWINEGYTFMDNLWLTIFPVLFFGLFFGMFRPKIGGWILVVSVSLGLVVGIFIEREFLWFMLVPLLIGILFIAFSKLKNIS